MARVTLDGVELTAGVNLFTPPTWRSTCGVSAPANVWTVAPGLAEQVLAKAETRITIEAGHKALEIERVVVTGEQASGNPWVRHLVLSDIRWYWPLRMLKQTWNLRTRTGSRRYVGDANVPVQVAPLADAIAFAPFSLVGEVTAARARDVVGFVLAELVGNEGWVSEARSSIQITPNDVELDGRGDVVLARALGVAGGLDVQVLPSGKVLLYDRVLGAERAMVEQRFPYQLEHLGQFRWIRMHRHQPRQLRGYVTREMEVRLDYVEEAPGATVSATTDQPRLACVVEQVDPRLTVAGQTETAGTFSEVDALLAGIAAEGDYPNGPQDPGPLTREKLQRFYMGGKLKLLYALGWTGIAPSRLWDARIGAFYRDYRLTFRVDRTFLQRILPGSIRPVRAGLIDAATAQRQPSPVYTDWTARPSMRWLVRDKAAALGWLVHGVPPDAGQSLGQSGAKAYPETVALGDMRQAPARLEVWDPLTGVLHVAFKLPMADREEQMVPCLLRDLPVADPEKVSLLGALATFSQAQLAKNHRLSTIISCIPAGPNSQASLHRYSVTFEEALARLGVAQGEMRPAGPDLEFRVHPALITARFGWDDGRREEILGAFDAKRPFPSYLIPTNDETVRDTVLSMAAAELANRLDHYEGQAAVAFDPEVRPIGALHTVAHTVDAKGRALTIAEAGRLPAPIQPEHLMRAETRRVLFREIGT